MSTIEIAPVTTGSDKQIAWATQIKTDAFAKHAEILTTNLSDTRRSATVARIPDREIAFAQTCRTSSEYAADFAAADAELAANSDARFWIDHRGESIRSMALAAVRAKHGK